VEKDQVMGVKRHKPEEIVMKLRQVEVLVGQGMACIDAIREIQITE
jgi:putative transposase